MNKIIMIVSKIKILKITKIITGMLKTKNQCQVLDRLLKVLKRKNTKKKKKKKREKKTKVKEAWAEVEAEAEVQRKKISENLKNLTKIKKNREMIVMMRIAKIVRVYQVVAVTVKVVNLLTRRMTIVINQMIDIFESE